MSLWTELYKAQTEVPITSCESCNANFIPNNISELTCEACQFMADYYGDFMEKEWREEGL